MENPGNCGGGSGIVSYESTIEVDMRAQFLTRGLHYKKYGILSRFSLRRLNIRQKKYFLQQIYTVANKKCHKKY